MKCSGCSTSELERAPLVLATKCGDGVIFERDELLRSLIAQTIAKNRTPSGDRVVKHFFSQEKPMQFCGGVCVSTPYIKLMGLLF